jgi:hypothetical protein
MNRSVRRVCVTLMLFSLAGCHSAMSKPPNLSADSTEGDFDNSSARWPLEFRAHHFGVHCFDTKTCEVRYGGWFYDIQEPTPSVASYERPHAELLSAGRGPIRNFPGPAVIAWHSSDGSSHQAEVDIGEIFRDQLVRHNVPREEVTEHGNDTAPEIILEVNNRTISVYMRATIWTKHEQIPGNQYSHSRDDLIQVYTRTY